MDSKHVDPSRIAVRAGTEVAVLRHGLVHRRHPTRDRRSRPGAGGPAPRCTWPTPGGAGPGSWLRLRVAFENCVRHSLHRRNDLCSAFADGALHTLRASDMQGPNAVRNFSVPSRTRPECRCAMRHRKAVRRISWINRGTVVPAARSPPPPSRMLRASAAAETSPHPFLAVANCAALHPEQTPLNTVLCLRPE